MAVPWDSNGSPKVPRKRHENIVYRWDSHGYSHGTSMILPSQTREFPLSFRGIPMGFLWDFYGFSVSLRLDCPSSHWASVFPWDFRGASMGHSQFSLDLRDASTGLSISHGASIDLVWSSTRLAVELRRSRGTFIWDFRRIQELPWCFCGGTPGRSWDFQGNSV